MNNQDQKALNRAVSTTQDILNILSQGGGGNLFPIMHCESLCKDLNILRIWASNTNRPSLPEEIAKESENLRRLADKVWKIFRTDRPLSKWDGEVHIPTEEGGTIFDFEIAVENLCIRLNGLLKDMNTEPEKKHWTAAAGDSKETEKPKGAGDISQKLRDIRSRAGRKASSFVGDRSPEVIRHDHPLIKKRFKQCKKQRMSDNAAAEEVARLLYEDTLIDNSNYQKRHIQTWDSYLVGKGAVLHFLECKTRKTGRKP